MKNTIGPLFKIACAQCDTETDVLEACTVDGGGVMYCPPPRLKKNVFLCKANINNIC